MRQADMPETAPPWLVRRLVAHDQAHVLRWWAELSSCERGELIHQLEQIDLGLLKTLCRSDTAAAAAIEANGILPPQVMWPSQDADDTEDRAAAARGEAAIRAGRLAIVLVAGGQGTRLGFPGPKGMFPIGPVSRRSLLQIHLEKVLVLSRRHGVRIPLYIMTSPDNHVATTEFLAAHGHFGLSAAQVHLFCQGTMPAIDAETGRLLLAAKGRIAVSPNGHGGVLHALATAGHLDSLAAAGIRHLFYFQVDNPLVKVADPVFLGRHIAADAEVSLKVIPKLSPSERLGLVVAAGGRTRVIEYSDLPAELVHAQGPDGGYRFNVGNIAVHFFEVSFLRRLAAGRTVLPYHRALKKVPYIADTGVLVEPDRPNAIKFEMFVFDALLQAERVLTVATSRREEFEPLKNAEGENSPATVRQALSNLYADWLSRAGVNVARRDDGAAAVPIEISPLFALDEHELAAKLDHRGPVTEPLLLAALPS